MLVSIQLYLLPLPPTEEAMTPPATLTEVIQQAASQARSVGITWSMLRNVIVKAATEAGQHHFGKNARAAILRSLHEAEEDQ